MLSVDISCPQGAQQQTNRLYAAALGTKQQTRPLSIDGTNKQTDAAPFHRPCSAYCAGFYGFIEDVMLPTNTSTMNTILVNY